MNTIHAYQSVITALILIILMISSVQGIMIQNTGSSVSSDLSKSPFLRISDSWGRACTPLKEIECRGYLIRKTASGCPAQPTCCGNGKCEIGENSANCYTDCKGQALSKNACPAIKNPSCKGRLIFSVQKEGGCPAPPTCCGDGICQSMEGQQSCPDDCVPRIAKKASFSCPKIAVPSCKGVLMYPPLDKNGCASTPSCCGDNKCDKTESPLSCQTDCRSKYISGNTYKPFSVKAKATYRDAVA